MACACVLPCDLSSAEPDRCVLESFAHLAARTDRSTMSKCFKNVPSYALYVGVACDCKLPCDLATAASSRFSSQSWQAAPTAAQRRSASITLLKIYVYVWPLAVRCHLGSANLSRALQSLFERLHRRLLPAPTPATRQDIPRKPSLTRCLIWGLYLLAVGFGHY